MRLYPVIYVFQIFQYLSGSLEHFWYLKFIHLRHDNENECAKLANLNLALLTLENRKCSSKVCSNKTRGRQKKARQVPFAAKLVYLQAFVHKIKTGYLKRSQRSELAILRSFLAIFSQTTLRTFSKVKFWRTFWGAKHV